MTNDKLLVNDDKTEFLMIGTKQQLAKVNIDHILIGDWVIRPKGVELGKGGRIRKYLFRRSTEMLIHAFVSSRVDYCNSLLYGLPAYQLNKL